MAIGSVIVPGLRQGGEPWEIITHGLSPGGVQPGGMFKKNNPGCNCCPGEEEDCEPCYILLTTSGFAAFTPADPENCDAVNGEFYLPFIEVPHNLAPPTATCQLDLVPNCWFSKCFLGPDGEQWYWEVGINGENRDTDGWVVVVSLANEDNTHVLWWIGPLPGGYVAWNGALDGLTFAFDNLNHCANQGGHACPFPPTEMIQGIVECEQPLPDCTLEVDFEIHPQEPLGGECRRICFETVFLNCQDENDCTLQWDFGDGSSPAFGATPCHFYDENGLYDVTLTATCGESVCTVTHEVDIDCPEEPPPGPQCTFCPTTPQTVCATFTGIQLCQCTVRGTELSGAISGHVYEWRTGTQQLNASFPLTMNAQFGNQCYWCYTGPVGGINFWRTNPNDFNCANLFLDSPGLIHVGLFLEQVGAATRTLGVQMALRATETVPGPLGPTFRSTAVFSALAVNLPLTHCNFDHVMNNDYVAADMFRCTGDWQDFFDGVCWTFPIPNQWRSGFNGNVHIEFGACP